MITNTPTKFTGNKEDTCAQFRIYISVSRSVSCSKCNNISHRKCIRLKNIRNKLYCESCIAHHEIEIYNSYYDAVVEICDINDTSTFNNEPTESLELLESMSCIMEACKPYSIRKFNKLRTKPISKPSTFSCHFLNIDGNASNFDLFAGTVPQFKHIFDVIGIAETNTDKECKDLYLLNGYSSIYQNRVSNKRKGSGVGLYIHEKHIYTKLNAQSLITENIESIFVKISHPLGDIFVGVIYRPPRGNLNMFNSELSSIMSSFCESENIFIIGDFNINLFHNNASVKLFEETFICNGFNPVISTHCKPNCHKSCIDNIFVKNVEGVLKMAP